MWNTLGQPKIISLLNKGLRANNLAHAYLFVGPPNVGKYTLAIDLARALNCSGNDPPCGKCSSCKKIIQGKHADVSIISLYQGQLESKNQSEVGIDDIKGIQHRAYLPPFEGKWKIYIINNVEKLSLEAANCLLKLLEEPPSKIMLVLLTSSEQDVLPTIVSRCQRIELKPIPYLDIERILVESHGIAIDKAILLSRLSNGRIGWALAAIVDENCIQQRNQQLSSIRNLIFVNWEDRFTYVAQFENNRKQTQEMLEQLLIWCRDVLMMKHDCQQTIINVDYVESINEWAQLLTLEEIKELINKIQMSLDYLSKSANIRLVLETLMIDLPLRKGLKPDLVSIRE